MYYDMQNAIMTKIKTAFPIIQYIPCCIMLPVHTHYGRLHTLRHLQYLL